MSPRHKTIGAVAALLLPVCCFVIYGYYDDRQQFDKRGFCYSNLKFLAIDSTLYAMDHSRRFPNRVGEVTTKAILEYPVRARLYVCPGSGRAPGALRRVDEWTDYILIPNRTEDDAPWTALAYCRLGNHGREGTLVAFVDRSVMWCTAEELARLTNNLVRGWEEVGNVTWNNVRDSGFSWFARPLRDLLEPPDRYAVAPKVSP